MHRRNRAGLKRIGALALALIMALGALGVAYSAWTETLYINSTVQTGTLDIDVAGCSSTFVYKVPPGGTEVHLVYPDGTEKHFYPNGTEVHRVYGSFDPSPLGTLIASAVTLPSLLPDADSATMTFTGIFPCIDFRADVQLEYVGTIPARVSVAKIYANDTGDTTLNALWALGVTSNHTYGAWIDGELSTNTGLSWTPIYDPLGLQLHQGDMVHVTLHVHLPEGSQYDGLSGLGFTGLITVVQYNMYEEPVTP